MLCRVDGGTVPLGTFEFADTAGACVPTDRFTQHHLHKEAVLEHLGRVVGALMLGTERLVPSAVDGGGGGAGATAGASNWTAASIHVSASRAPLTTAALALSWVVCLLALSVWTARLLVASPSAAVGAPSQLHTAAVATSWQVKVSINSRQQLAVAYDRAVHECTLLRHTAARVCAQVLRAQLTLSVSVLQLPVAAALCRTLRCPDASVVWASTSWHCWGPKHAMAATTALAALLAFTALTTTGESCISRRLPRLGHLSATAMTRPCALSCWAPSP